MSFRASRPSRSDGTTTRIRAREAIGHAIERVRGEGGVLLLTDMFGGTPTNLALTFLDPGRVEVVTGVNLPMLIKLASLRASADMLVAARELREHGRHAIWVASDLVSGRPVTEGERREVTDAREWPSSTRSECTHGRPRASRTSHRVSSRR